MFIVVVATCVAQNPENCAAEIPQRLANSRECRAYFCEPDIACRDGTGWLGRRDSNLCISKSDLLNFIPPQRVLAGIRRVGLMFNGEAS